MLSVARPATSSTPVRSRRLTAAAVQFRVAVVAALCSDRAAISVLREFRPDARLLGVGELLWLSDEIERRTGTPIRHVR